MAAKASIMAEKNPLYYLQEMYKYTPDFGELRKSKEDEHLVFITGNMMLGRSLSHVLTGCNYYGKGMTTGSDYMMKRTSANGPPFVLHIKNRVLKHSRALITPNMVGKIEGDVVGVPLRLLTKIDQYEGNGDCANREKRYVTLLHSDQGRQSVSCHMYLGDQEYYEQAFFDLTKLYGVSTIEQYGAKRFYYI